MSNLEAIVLGLVQALTEFLPVSSSGHLVLAQSWFGDRPVDVLFNVLLHAATMLAVLLYFRREIAELLAGVFGRTGTTAPFAGHERRAVGLLALANLPTAVLGYSFELVLGDSLSRPFLVGCMLIVTGVVLWLGRNRSGARTIAEMSAVDALWIGTVQGIAVLPGLSRSGLTIVAALLLGMERSLAVKFSLLMSIPAIAGATLLMLSGVESAAEASTGPYLVGMVVSGVAGYAAIHWVLLLVERRHFFRFAYYVWPLGAVAIATALS